MRKKSVQTFTLGGALFLNMLAQGYARLNRNRKAVNELNVFPIPDGDTGDNMCLTLSAGYSKAAALEGASLGELADAVSSGMLMGARGNSGVILSRIFAGLAKGLSKKKETNTAGFANAMKSAVDEAYASVSNPVEGTILTVVREGTDAARAKSGESLENYVAALLHGMEESLEATPDKLAVLKEAGVVDSGGAGLLHIFYGFQDALLGIIDNTTADIETGQASSIDLSAFDENTELEFGYCTEFLLRLQSSKVDLATFDEKVIERYLQGAGDSVVFFREGSIIKVHVHSKTPGDILSHCQRWGEFLTLKIENMTLQHHNSAFAEQHKPVKRKEFGSVTVASGEGLKRIFGELGADYVVEGGQTMNPSVADFVTAFDSVRARHIFVFPNNSNIVMTARQAADVYSDARIHVIPTKNTGAGYVALASMDTTSGNADEIEGSLVGIAANVVCGMVSSAIRDTVSGNLEVHKGDFIGFRDDDILSDGDSPEAAAAALCDTLRAGEHDVVLVFTGADCDPERSEELNESLCARFPATEFIFNNGGQAVFDYIIVLC